MTPNHRARANPNPTQRPADQLRALASREERTTPMCRERVEAMRRAASLLDECERTISATRGLHPENRQLAYIEARLQGKLDA